jgi:hypothetical protein
MSNNRAKERNSELACCINCRISGWETTIPLGQMMVFLHSLHGLGIDWGNGQDPAEKRNRAYCEFLQPEFDKELINAIISSHFKPRNFIHPFERVHMTAGFNDPSVLSAFCRDVDDLAERFRSGKLTQHRTEFLVFIYIIFLIVHPFMDGNGGIARSLLDYYNERLGFCLKPIWNQRDFKSMPGHKEAFSAFFTSAAKIPKVQDMARADEEIDFPKIAEFLVARKNELTKLAASIIHCCEDFMENQNYGAYPGISDLAAIIQQGH